MCSRVESLAAAQGRLTAVSIRCPSPHSSVSDERKEEEATVNKNGDEAREVDAATPSTSA